MSNTTERQAGFVSIFTTLMIMGIITLLVIGFSYSTRQAQKRALDDLLNTQAFYAAESGVNDAINALATTPNQSKTDCRTGGTGTFNYDIDASINTRYSCLLINSTPPSLVWDSVPVTSAGTVEPIVAEINASAAVSILDFSWDSASSNSDPKPPYNFTNSSPTLPDAASWGAGGNGIGIVKVDLVRTSDLTRSGLANGYTFYLYPSTTGTVNNGITVNNGTRETGATLVTRCDSTPRRCAGRITLAGTGSGSTNYIIRLQAYYNPVQLEVTPRQSNSAGVTLINGQAIVDSTGQANDVFRRIQVRVPLSPNPGFSEGLALTAGDSICKRMITGLNDTRVDAPGGISDGSCSILND